MKRIFAFILAALMLSMTACSETGSDTEENTVSAEAENPAQAEETETKWIDTVPADVTFDGYTFNIGWSTTGSGIDECAPDLDDITGDIVGEAVHQRNLLTEDKLDISITGQQLTPSWTEAVAAMKSLILAGDNSFDAYSVSTWFMFQASINGLLHPLDEIATLDLSNVWWEQILNEMIAVDGKTHYMANGMINFLDDYAVSCIYFNKPLCTDLGLDHPYEMVRNGDWTMDKLLEYMEIASADLDGNGVYDEHDRYGFIDNSGLLNRLLPGFGAHVIQFDESGAAVINQSELFFNQLDKIMSQMLDQKNKSVLLQDGPIGYERSGGIFPEGRALFRADMVRSINDLRGSMEQDFGVIPSPKYNEEQEQYYSSYNTAWGSSYGMPITNLEYDRTGWILEVMGYYSKDTIYPATIEKNILTKTVRDEESADMLRLMFECKFYELGSWGTKVYGEMCGMALNGKNNFASKLKMISKVTGQEFKEVKNYYDFGG